MELSQQGEAKSVAPQPIEEGIWVVIFGELSVFTVFFATFLYYRTLSPEVYRLSQSALQLEMGALNTLFLLTSSYFVALATQALRKPDGLGQARGALRRAIVFGLAFVVVKLYEYAHAFDAGYDVLTNEFFMFYFTLTGIHLMHVLVGLSVLTALGLQIRNKMAGDGELGSSLVGFATNFWHMVDIVWIVLFPLLYLLR